jgi:spermidine synthase
MRPPRTLVLLLSALAFCAVSRADDKLLYEKPSKYNHILVTEDEQGLRTLIFERNGVRQSVVRPGDPDHLELAYTRAMTVGPIVVEEPKRILVIGLGGGSIPSFLHKHYPQATIDAVDLDPAVIEVAGRYFGFREDRTLHAFAADGRQFIEKTRDPYDLILLDAFGPDSIPYHLATKEFLQSVRKTLTPKGAVVANVWSSESNDLYGRMVRTYQEVFGDLWVLEVRGRGNRILVARADGRAIDRDDLARRAERIAKQKQFRFNLAEMIRQGLEKAEKDPQAKVLADAEKPAIPKSDTGSE